MKFTASTKDPMEAKRLAKSLDMALVIWEFWNNGEKRIPQEFKESENDEQIITEVFEVFRQIMEEHNIIIDDLTE